MEDLREVEIKNIKEVCTLISNQYPHLLRMQKYEHPVKGIRNSLNILSKSTSVDIELLQQITIDFEDRSMTIKTPYHVFILDHIFKDESVINV